MKVTSFEIIVIEIPLLVSVAHALAERKTARNVLVRAADEAGNVGWGESCPRPYVTGETVEGVCADLRERLLPPFIGVHIADIGAAVGLLSEVLQSLPRQRQAAFCAAELALLDLVSRRAGQSAGSVLGPIVRDTLSYSGVIAATSVDGVRKYATFLHGLRARQVKLKVGAKLDENLAFLRAAREILGADVELRIDANSAWDAGEAIRQLTAMAPFVLAGVEQPVAGQDFDGMRAVTAAGLADVVADESLVSVEDATRLAAERGCDVFNIRISKCGGLINAGRIYRIARAAGLDCQLGAQVGETGVLSAAGRQFGTRCPGLRWFEGSYDRLLLERSISDPDITIGAGGTAMALDGPGLGVTVKDDVIAELAVQRLATG